MDSITITVAPEDIAHGKRSSPEYCPIAQAMMRADPGLFRVRVTRETVSTFKPRRKEAYSIPQEGRDFIDSYDQGTPIKDLQQMDEADRTFSLTRIKRYKLGKNWSA